MSQFGGTKNPPWARPQAGIINSVVLQLRTDVFIIKKISYSTSVLPVHRYISKINVIL